MTAMKSLFAALLLVTATPAFAQQVEGIPNFEACGDKSLAKAMKVGVTLGISPSPPYSWLNPEARRPRASMSRSTRPC